MGWGSCQLLVASGQWSVASISPRAIHAKVGRGRAADANESVRKTAGQRQRLLRRFPEEGEGRKRLLPYLDK